MAIARLTLLAPDARLKPFAERRPASSQIALERVAESIAQISQCPAIARIRRERCIKRAGQRPRQILALAPERLQGQPMRRTVAAGVGPRTGLIPLSIS